MSEFILRAKRPHRIEIAVGNPTFENAEIWEYRGGVLDCIHPVTHDKLNRLRPVPPPEYMQREKVMGEAVLDKPIAPNHFIVGVNPHIQAIYSTVREAGTATYEDIYRSLVKDYRILPDDRWGMEIVKDLIDLMYREGRLVKIKKKGRAYYGPGLAPRGKYHLVEFYPGYDPVAYQIVWYVEVKGMATRAEIHEYIIHRLEFLKNPSELDCYLEMLVKSENLEVKEGGWFVFKKPLEAFS